METEKKKCLNCGTELISHYCHHCGQSASTSPRIDSGTFWRTMFESVSRMSLAFFRTSSALMLRPWDVIKTYIRGNRVRYLQPFSMLLQLIVIEGVLKLFFGHIFNNTNLFIEQSSEGQGNWLANFFLQSDFILTFIFSVPIVFVTYLCFWWHGSRRFNVYEYVIAIFYFCCSMTLYSIIIDLLSTIIDPKNQYYLNFILLIPPALILCIGTLSHSFPMRNLRMKILLYALFPIVLMTVIITGMFFLL